MLCVIYMLYIQDIYIYIYVYICHCIYIVMVVITEGFLEAAIEI